MKTDRKSLVSVVLFCCCGLASCLMTMQDFLSADLARCYDQGSQDPRRVSEHNVNGQVLPLASSLASFVGLVERYESLHGPARSAGELSLRLLRAFRIDDLDPDLEDRELRDSLAGTANELKRAVLGVRDQQSMEQFRAEWSEDERCALHLLLSHTLNDTGGEPADFDKTKARRPLEVGVASLGGGWRAALSLGRVLLGVSAGFLDQRELKANAVLKAMKKEPVSSLDDVALNPVFALTLGDLVSRLAPKNTEAEVSVLPDGLWDDVVCPVAYRLEDNNGGYVTAAELRGAIDGLYIGKAIQENGAAHAGLGLSQILRMYYGPSGLLDNGNSRWCSRRPPNHLGDLGEQMLNFHKLFKVANGGMWGEKINEQISRAVQEINNLALKDKDLIPECSVSESSQDKIKPFTNIFVVMDNNLPKLQFQREVIGNLSASLELRPHGNLMGVYTNAKPIQQHALDTVVKNTGIAGCPACFAKYYQRQASKEDEIEVLRDLNATLTAFEEERPPFDHQPRSGSPGKVVLYFNFGNPSDSNRLQEALWDFKRYFGGVTILAVGDNRASVKMFAENEQTDIFTSSTAAQKTAKDIAERLKNVPGEFQFKECHQSSPSKEAENRQLGYISPNKIQYWAMYPQYFLKSFALKLKFKAQEGSSVTFCFTRWFPDFVDNRRTDCRTSNGEEVEFHASDPCKKKNVYNCEPFYFSVEAKKQSPELCKSLSCSTPHDVQFEFQHEGISCNTASFISSSNLMLLLALATVWMLRH